VRTCKKKNRLKFFGLGVLEEIGTRAIPPAAPDFYGGEVKEKSTIQPTSQKNETRDSFWKDK